MTPALTQTKRERADAVWSQVMAYYGYTRAALCGHDKHIPIAEARQCLMTLLYYWAGLTATETGHEVNRDHSTVIHGHTLTMRRLGDQASAEAAYPLLYEAVGHILAPCVWTPPARPFILHYDAAIAVLTARRAAVVGQERAAWRVDASVEAETQQERTKRQRERTRRAEMEARFWRAQARRVESVGRYA